MAKVSAQIQKCKTGETVTIRNATAPDAAKMHALGISVFQTSDYLVATANEFAAIPMEQQIARINRLEASESDLWLVAECGNDIIGMLDFQSGKSKKTKHKGSFGMVVNPAWQQKGIGRLLLSALIDWVQAHPQLEVINLTVSEENKSAIALYKKLGFEITGREPFGLRLPSGEFLVDITMTLKA